MVGFIYREPHTQTDRQTDAQRYSHYTLPPVAEAAGRACWPLCLSTRLAFSSSLFHPETKHVTSLILNNGTWEMRENSVEL